MAVVIGVGGGNKSPKSGGTEIFTIDDGRLDDRNVSRSAVVGGEAQKW